MKTALGKDLIFISRINVVVITGYVLYSLFTDISGCNKNPSNYTRDTTGDAEYYSLQRFTDSLERILSAQDSVIGRRDTVIKWQVKRIPIAARNTYNLSNDSSILLFLSWTKQFEDSNFRKLYFGK